MAFVDNLPTELQTTIQQGWLDPSFEQGLQPKLGFRVLAEKEKYDGQVGQTVTRTKWGRLAPVRTPLPVRVNSDLDDGLTDANYHLEQYILGIDQYASTMTLSLASSTFSKANLFLQNAYELGMNANQSIDMLCYDALYNTYLGMNTYVKTTLGGAGVALAVNDVRGFFQSIQASTGKLLPTSVSNPLAVSVNGVLGSVTGVVADGVAPTNINFMFNNLTFSGSSTNTSTTPGGYSGVLTFAANVLVINGTAGNTVKATIAPNIFRPYDPSSGVMRANSTKLVAGDVLTMRMIRNAAARMRANAINTELWCFTDDVMMQSLFNDVEFRQYFQGNPQTSEYENGIITKVMGINFVRTNIAQMDSATVSGQIIHRAIIASPGALIEGDYTATAYGNDLQSNVSHVLVSDNVAHITRPPLNRLADVCTQSWTAYLGFTTPSDYYANPTSIPTADYSMFKRAMILEATEY